MAKATATVEALIRIMILTCLLLFFGNWVLAYSLGRRSAKMECTEFIQNETEFITEFFQNERESILAECVASCNDDEVKDLKNGFYF